MDVNEGDEWPVNSAFGPSDPSPMAVTDAQNASGKNSERPSPWTAICPINYDRNLGKSYIKTTPLN